MWRRRTQEQEQTVFISVRANTQASILTTTNDKNQIFSSAEIIYSSLCKFLVTSVHIFKSKLSENVYYKRIYNLTWNCGFIWLNLFRSSVSTDRLLPRSSPAVDRSVSWRAFKLWVVYDRKSNMLLCFGT